MPGQNQSAANISADVLIPGPQGSTVLKNILLNRSDDTLRRAVQLHQAYGDLVHLQIASRHIYLLFHPDDVQRVLQTNNRNYVKGELLDKLRVAAGNGLFTSEGDFWRRQRRMMQPFFHRTVIASFGDIMVAEIQQLLAQWDRYAAGGTACELQEQMMRVTLSVVAKALFTTALGDAELATVHATLGPILAEIAARSRRPFGLVEKLPTRANRAFTRNLAELTAIVDAIIAGHRAPGAAYGDLLQMLIDARDEETGAAMSDQQLRDEVITLFVAGHETTATALTWAFKLLAEQPVVRRVLYEEVDRVLGWPHPHRRRLPQPPLHAGRLRGDAASLSARRQHRAHRPGARHAGRPHPAGGQQRRHPHLRPPPPPRLLGQPRGLRPHPHAPRGAQGAAPLRLHPLQRRPPLLHRRVLRQARGRVDSSHGGATV